MATAMRGGFGVGIGVNIAGGSRQSLVVGSGWESKRSKELQPQRAQRMILLLRVLLCPQWSSFLSSVVSADALSKEDTEGTENDLAPPCSPVSPVVKLLSSVVSADALSKEDTEGTENDLAPRCSPVSPVVKLLSSVVSADALSKEDTEGTENDFAPPCSPVSPVVKLFIVRCVGRRSLERGHRGHRE